MADTSEPESEMAPSEAPAAGGTPWAKIASVLLVILILVAAVGAYYAASRPAPGGITVNCPAGYAFNAATSTCESTDTIKPTAVGTANGEGELVFVEIGQDLTFDGGGSTDNVAVTGWVWNFGDGSHGVGETYTKAYWNGGSYIVSLTASDALGNSDANDENLIRVRILEPVTSESNDTVPLALLRVDRDVIRAGDSVAFDGSSSWIWRWNDTIFGLREVCTHCYGFVQEADALTYGWNFADGAASTSVNVTHKFDNAGTYGVRLTVTAYNGMQMTVFRTIRVLAIQPAQTVKNPGTIVRATFGEVAHLDPARAYDSSSGEVLDQVLEKLVFYDRDSLTAFRPVLSTNVPSTTDATIDASGREYTFHIRQGVKFHNGADLEATDVEYSIERNIISDFTGGPMWLLMEVGIGPGIGAFDPANATHRQRVQDFVRVSGNDVIFNLTFAFPPFLSLVASWGAWIVDEQTTRAAGGWPQAYDQVTLTTYNDDLSLGMDDVAIGTGPYVLDSWDFGVQVVLKKFANYWNAAANPNAVSTVIIKKVVEPGTLLLMLQNGDADFAEVQTPQKPQVLPLVASGDVSLVEGLPRLSLVYSGINFAIDPTSPYGGVLKTTPGQLGEDGIPVDFFTDIYVRRALAYCVDYNTLITQTLSGLAQQARGPIPEGLQGFSGTSPIYSQSAANALSAMQQAWGGNAWTVGFTFQILYNEGNTVRQTAATMMADCITNMGNARVHVSTLGVPWATYLGALIGNQWTIGTIGWGADYADAHNFAQPFMDGRTGAFAAYTGYNNATVNSLIDQGVTETNPTVRAQIYAEIQQAAYNDLPGIFLYQPTVFEVHRSWIQGWYHNEILGEDTYFFAYTKG